MKNLTQTETLKAFSKTRNKTQNWFSSTSQCSKAIKRVFKKIKGLSRKQSLSTYGIIVLLKI